MNLDAPHKLGPFTVSMDGSLTPSTPDHFPSFRVGWRGHVIRARLTSAAPSGGSLALQAVVGRVPSTGRADAHGTSSRRLAFAAMKALPATLPEGWRLCLLADHRVVAETHLDLQLPTSAEHLVTELSLFLLRLEPYIDLLAEGMGVEPVDGAPCAGQAWAGPASNRSFN